jgi:hypothetical protein
MTPVAAANRYRTFDELLPRETACSMIRLCERVGRYPVVANGMSRPIDGSKHYARRPDPGQGERFSARSQYFRERYAWGGEILAPGLEPLFHHPGMLQAAGELYGCPRVVPRVTYANLLLPGHDLALHTDVAEYRGLDREQNPLWLLVAMHHSGLFERWRVRVATCTSWYQDCEGGEVIFYPEGAAGARVELPARFNTGLLFDADSVFHGVRPVRGAAPPAPAADQEMHLDFAGSERWQVVSGDRVLCEYGFDEFRFSITWKAYCFADEAEQRTWRDHSDDIRPGDALKRLVAELERRGVPARRLPAQELIRSLVSEFVRFPPPEAG